jgi:hypothetical protein
MERFTGNMFDFDQKLFEFGEITFLLCNVLIESNSLAGIK